MLRALYSSAAGMQSQQTNLDVIANNLANVNTTGFKRSRAHFEDLLYQTVQGTTVVGAPEAGTAPAIQIGRGVRRGDPLVEDPIEIGGVLRIGAAGRVLALARTDLVQIAYRRFHNQPRQGAANENQVPGSASYVATGQPQVGADAKRMVDDALRRLGVTHHCRPPRPHDAGLLATDAFAVVAKGAFASPRDSY